MLKTGSVPVSDQIHRTPAVPAGDSECMSCAFGGIELTPSNSQGQSTCRGRGRRRGGAAQVAGGDGHVSSSWNCKRNYIVQRKSAPVADEGGRFCSVVSAEIFRFTEPRREFCSGPSPGTGVGVRRLHLYLQWKESRQMTAASYHTHVPNPTVCLCCSTLILSEPSPIPTPPGGPLVWAPARQNAQLCTIIPTRLRSH